MKMSKQDWPEAPRSRRGLKCSVWNRGLQPEASQRLCGAMSPTALRRARPHGPEAAREQGKGKGWEMPPALHRCTHRAEAVGRQRCQQL